MSDLPEATAAKYDKCPAYTGVDLLFPRALAEIAFVSRYGATKHRKSIGSRDNLVDVPDADTVYLNAERRHMLAIARGEEVNEQDDGMLHRAQKAWNALADLEIYLTNQEKE